MIGSQLGPYQLVEQIGAGAQATVYRAYQSSMGRYVAIKVLPRHFASDESFAERFRREARTIARLEHAHILPVYDFGEERDVAYIVMRYLEAGTLKDIMAERKLPLPDSIHLMCQISSALQYAHRRGVVHRDVKPANIMVDREGNTYLTDFGIAKMLGDATGLTASGTIGTPAYMSPEQGQTGRIDGRSDIYSMGVLLHHLVTDKLPYDAPTAMAVVLQHINDPVPSVCDKFPDVPVGVERVIQKAMAKDPDHRFQSAGELCDALQSTLGAQATIAPDQLRAGAQHAFQTLVARREEVDAQPQPEPRPYSPPARQPSRRRNRALLFGLGGLAAFAVLAGMGVIIALAVLGGRNGSNGGQTAESAVAGAESEGSSGDGGSEEAGEPASEATPAEDGTTPSSPLPSGDLPFLADFEGADPLASWAVTGDWRVSGDFYEFQVGPVLAGDRVLLSEQTGSILKVLGLLESRPEWVDSEDYFISMRVKLVRSGAAARLFFSETGSDLYALEFSTSNVTLKRFQGGQDTLPPESTGLPLESGRWYEIWVWRRGGNVTAYVNGQWFLQTLGMSSLPPGTIGLETLGEGGVMIDDLTVTATNPASENFEGQGLPETWSVVGGVELRNGDESQVLAGVNLDTDAVGPITEELADFTLICQVQAQQGSSAIQFRKSIGGQYELQFEAGHVSLLHDERRDQLPVETLAEARNVYGPSAARTLALEARGPRITAALDGLPIIDVTDPDGQAAGMIAVKYGDDSAFFLDDCVIYSRPRPSNDEAQVAYDLWESTFNDFGSTARPATGDDFSEQCVDCWLAPPGTPADGPGNFDPGGFYTIGASDSGLWWLLSDVPTVFDPYLSAGDQPSTNFIGRVGVKVDGGSGWVGVRAQPDSTGLILEQFRVRLTNSPDGPTATVESAGTGSGEIFYDGPWPAFEAVGPDAFHNVTVVAQGDQLAFFVNGSFLAFVPVTDAERLQGTLAIGASPGGTASFDDVEIWDIRNLGSPDRTYRP